MCIIQHEIQDEERRLVDNALGCVYALSLKKISLAESYFRSAMLVRQEKRERFVFMCSNGKSTIVILIN